MKSATIQEMVGPVNVGRHHHDYSSDQESFTPADLPLILILSVYTDFLPLEFGKIQIVFLEIWQFF